VNAPDSIGLLSVEADMPTIRCLVGPIIVGDKFLYEHETREVTDQQLTEVRKHYTAKQFEVIGETLMPAEASGTSGPTVPVVEQMTDEGGTSDQLVSEEAADEHRVIDAEDTTPKRGGRAKRRA